LEIDEYLVMRGRNKIGLRLYCFCIFCFIYF